MENEMTDQLTKAARDVLSERQRQISEEGWTPEHDDAHKDGELASAAAAYVTYRSLMDPVAIMGSDIIADLWPWAWDWWKPTTPRRDLIKAGALILAEIERLDRAEGRT
jgi:hypothetical protein